MGAKKEETTQKALNSISHKVSGAFRELKEPLQSAILALAKDVIAASAGTEIDEDADGLDIYVELSLECWLPIEEGAPKAMAETEIAPDLQLKTQIFKRDDEKQLVYMAVLVPEQRDVQGDIISDEEVEKALHTFMTKLSRGETAWQLTDPTGALRAGNRRSGVMHKDWSRPIDIVECYRLPMDWPISDTRAMKAGTWVLVDHVLDTEVWELVKAGKLNGASIMGHADAIEG